MNNSTFSGFALVNLLQTNYYPEGTQTGITYKKLERLGDLLQST